MKILMIVSGTVNSSLSARAVNFGIELVKLGHDVSIISPSCDKYNNFKIEKFKNLKGVKIIRPYQFKTRYQTLNMIPYILSSIYFVLNLEVEIVHIYKPTPINIIGFISRIKFKNKIVVDIDDIGELVMERENNPTWKSKLTGISENIAIVKSNTIVVASTYLNKKYQKLLNKQIAIIPNGATIQIDYKNIKISNEIIFLGSLNSRNFLEPFIKLLPELLKNKEFKNLRIKIIGDGTELEYFKNMTQRLDIKRNVDFIGWVKKDNLNKYLKAGSIGYCVAPNRPEYRAASNQKIFDYMSYGVVPIINRIGDLESYIDNGKAGYIVEKNVKNTLESALQNKSLRLIKSKNAIQLISKRYSWDKLTKELENIYKDTINEKFE